MEITIVSNKNISAIANILADHLSLDNYEGVKKYGFPIPGRVRKYQTKFCSEYTDIGSTLYYHLRALNVASIKSAYIDDFEKQKSILLDDNSKTVYYPTEWCGFKRGIPSKTCVVSKGHYQLLKYMDHFLFNVTNEYGNLNADGLDKDALYEALISYRDALRSYIIGCQDAYKEADIE